MRAPLSILTSDDATFISEEPVFALGDEANEELCNGPVPLRVFSDMSCSNGALQI